MNMLDGFSVKCICPACFSEIYLAECRIVSGITSGKVLKTPPTGALARTRRVEPLDGPTYTLELAHRECTNCRYLLPRNIESVPSITLAIVGDTFSGKSHYIAALIRQIRTEWVRNSAGFARFTCLTPDVEDYYTKEYFERLFIKKQTLAPNQPATSPHAKPLIYSLALSPSRNDLPTETNLMIYDTSGEDFVREARLVTVARFVLNTTAFIFVADPFTMTPLFQHLPRDLQTNLKDHFILGQTRRAAERLHAILSVYGRFRKEGKGMSFPNTPIGVMVSKSDLFKSFNPPNAYTFMENPSYGHSIDLQDINIVDGEVRGLLEKYKQHDLLVATNRLKRLKFFATSATGEPPDANEEFQNVNPCRCLDPVLWILHQLGIMTASR